MEKWSFLLLLAIISSEALGFSYRNKRQAESGDSSSGKEDLEDRYGWNRPDRPNRPNWQWQGQGNSQGRDSSRGRGNSRGRDNFQARVNFQGRDSFQDRDKVKVNSQDKDKARVNNQAQAKVGTTPTPNAATTQSEAFQDCMRSCPVTAEYVPMCGSDGVTYSNLSRMSCARACGVSVKLVRASHCPTATAAPVN